MNRSRRIEMVIPTLEAAGMETITAHLTWRLLQKGYEVGVTCIYQGGPLQAWLEERGIDVTLVPLPGFLPNVWPPAMRAHLRARRPHVVHSHSGAWLKSSLPTRIGGTGAHVHTVHGLHDEERLKDLAMMRAGSEFSDAVVAVSHPLADYLRARVKVPHGKVVTILNGVDETHYRPDGPTGGLRARLSLDPNAVLCGAVARLSPVKDHLTMVRAFGLLHEREPTAHLVLVGDGPLRSTVEREIARLDLTDLVHLVGAVPDTAPVYRELDVFVLSSVAEGTSMSILEAMSSGVAVAATAVGGNVTLLGNGRFGELVPPRSPAALASALQRLVGDPSLRNAFATRARDFVLRDLTLDSMTEHYMDVYERSIRVRHGR